MSAIQKQLHLESSADKAAFADCNQFYADITAKQHQCLTYTLQTDASWLHGAAAVDMQRVSWRFVAVQAGRDTAKSSAAFGSVLLGAVKGGLVEMPLFIQGFSIVAIAGD
ncbi:uncharacterized protein DS421_9g284130 [Arachis hypogaea]|nr:uncharacterized protein DS421_9g284130 [Arachis hypogaea]